MHTLHLRSARWLCRQFIFTPEDIQQHFLDIAVPCELHYPHASPPTMPREHITHNSTNVITDFTAIGQTEKVLSVLDLKGSEAL
jgi:hypothetical protein